MRLLFIHEVNWRRKVVYEIHDFPELLSLRGHEVVFIDFAEGERPTGWRRLLDLKTRVYPDQSRVHEGSSVEVRTPGRVLPPPLDRLLASVTQVPVIWRALKREHFDAVVLYGVPTNGWQTVRIAQRSGVPVLFRTMDVSHVLRKSIFRPLIKLAERSIYKRADWISTNNVALRDYCIEHGADPDRISVDYAGVDFGRFRPGPKRLDLLERYGLSEDDRIVMFMGTFYRFAGLDWFIEAIADHLRTDPTLKVILVGGGEADQALRTLVSARGLQDRVVFTGVVSYDDLPDHLRLAEVGICPFRPQMATDNALVTKVIQYVTSGLAAVSTPLLGTQGLLGDGEGVLYRDLSSFVDEVVALAGDRTRAVRLAEVGRAALMERCDWSQALERLEEVIELAGDRHG